tara:strand:+ start:41 stop:841 length:801 start_codon:yes stop_codon:yes gene_type:complete
VSKKLILFLGIGLSIFLVDLFLNPPNEEKTIYITNEEVIALINTWSLQMGREPNNDEIRSIIDSLVEEEILYREALRLGLDSEDRIIKRRLAQKITFLKQETISTEPKIKELEVFYEKNKGSYLLPKSFSFTHIYFAENKDGDSKAEKAKLDLKDNKSVLNADPFLLGKNFSNRSLLDIKRDFGEDFATAFIDLSLNNWEGPIKSTYGSHLIKILDTREEYMPTFEEVISRVKVDFLLEQRDKQIKEFVDELKTDYQVIISPSFTQ